MAYPTGLRHDPVPRLLASGNPALVHATRRHLLGDGTVDGRALWERPEAVRILRRQQADGRWRYPGGYPEVRSADNYDQLETYRQLGVLVAKFALDRRHPATAKAAAFLASFQTEAGDYRGIYGNQYSPNYSAAITELLILAGYGRSAQVERTMRWLLSIRQDDGGWAIPTRTLGLPLSVMLTTAETLEPDRSKPSAHLVTGIVLRALAAHPRYRRAAATREAADLLASRFFTRDRYTDHVAASYWLVFSYPFWWTDLLSALDSLTTCGYGPDDPGVARGLAWFVDNQDAGGLWNAGRNRPKDRWSDLWVAFAACRMLRRAGIS